MHNQGKGKYTDEEVDKMLEEWDVVNCKLCGKEISMKDAELVADGKFFICKKHIKQGE